MSTLRFRAWLVEDKEMWLPQCDDDQYDIWANYYRSEKDSMVLMQSTGLKDTNGVEVFAGDVLDFDAREWGEENFRSVVQWNKEEAAWDFGGGTARDVKEWRSVIGNIYQDPSLLPL